MENPTIVVLTDLTIWRISSLSRGFRILSVAVARVAQVDSP